MSTELPAVEPIGDDQLRNWRIWLEHRPDHQPTDIMVRGLRALLSRLDAAEANARRMRGALEALGVLPEGYCYCPNLRDATLPDHEHTGECRDARAALKEGGQ